MVRIGEISIEGEARSSSSRLVRLRDRVMARNGSFVDDFNPYLRDVALWRAMKPPRSCVQVRAALLYEVVALAPIVIPLDWTLAGEHLIHRHLGTGFGFNHKNLSDAMSHLAALGVSGDDVCSVAEAVRCWTASNPTPLEIGTAGEHAGNVSTGWANADGAIAASGWMENHSVRDFAKVLRLGFKGIRAEIEALLESANIADADFPQKENFWLAALEVCDAGVLLGRLYAKKAVELARTVTGPADKRRLEQMAKTCERVPAEGARTFFEAVQALWFAHILTCGEDGINANSIGRLDQILWPYYEADLKTGRITRADALTIMDEFACKMYLDYDVQAIVLGGVDTAGRDAVNELTYVILDATEDAGLIRDLSIRSVSWVRPTLPTRLPH